MEIVSYINTKNLCVLSINTNGQLTEKTYRKLESLQTKHKNLYLERELLINKYNVNEIHKIVEKLNKEKPPLHSHSHRNRIITKT